MSALPDYVSLIGALASVIAGIAVFVLSKLFRRSSSMMRKRLRKSELTQADNAIASLRADVADLRSSFETGFSAESRDIGVNIIVNRIDKLELDLGELRRLLFDDPEAALTVPLLRKDVESVRQDNENLRKELARISELSKWFIGIMLTMSFGLLALAVSILLKGGK